MGKDYRSCLDASYRMPEAKWYPPADDAILDNLMKQTVDSFIEGKFASRDAIIRQELLLLLASADHEDTTERRARLEEARNQHLKKYSELVVLKMELTITTKMR